jgi:hypothetical protein
MMHLRNTLLASAALLSCGAGARAADLPAFKSAPVSYVRVCDAFGTGYFYIPGTDTCVKVGGQLRAEYTIRGGAPTGNAFARALNQSGQLFNRDYTAFRGRGYLNAESKTATAYGTLRTFVSIRITDETTNVGPSGGGKVAVAGSPIKANTSLFQGLPPGQEALLDKGFIQFAGITAGRINSFFDFDAQSHEFLTATVANSNQVTEVLAYTATFGGGLAATISVEDATERRIGDNGSVQANINPTATKAGYLAYAGETIPDIVGNLRAEESWGTAQLAGAYHNVSSLAVNLPTSPAVFTVPKDQDGFAGIAGVKVLLPFLAKGDNFTLQGTYEKGAIDYLNSLNYYNGATNVYAHDVSVGIPVNDGFVLPNGKIGLNTGWGIYGAFQHYWAPTWNSSIFGNYEEIRNPYAAQLLTTGADNAKIYQIGGNLVWTPVKDFLIGGEVVYTNLQLKGPLALTGTNANGATIALPSTNDDIRARLSLRRSF